MRVLLDSHTLIWAYDDPKKLSTLATVGNLIPGIRTLQFGCEFTVRPI